MGAKKTGASALVKKLRRDEPATKVAGGGKKDVVVVERRRPGLSDKELLAAFSIEEESGTFKGILEVCDRMEEEMIERLDPDLKPEHRLEAATGVWLTRKIRGSFRQWQRAATTKPEQEVQGP